MVKVNKRINFRQDLGHVDSFLVIGYGNKDSSDILLALIFASINYSGTVLTDNSLVVSAAVLK